MEQEKETKFFTFFKKIASELPFSEEKKSERLLQKKLIEQSKEIENKVNELIDADALVTVYKLVSNGYDLNKKQQNKYDEKIKELYLSKTNHNQLKLLVGAGHAESTDFIMNEVLCVNKDVLDIDKIEILKDNLLNKENVNLLQYLEKNIDSAMKNITIQLNEVNYRSQKKSQSSDLADHLSMPSLSKSIKHLINENMFKNINLLYFDKLFDEVKKNLMPEQLLKISSDLQIFIDKKTKVNEFLKHGIYKVYIKDDKTLEYCEELKEKINNLLSNEYEEGLNMLLVQHIGVSMINKKQINIDISNSVFNITKEIKEISEMGEEYIAPIKTKLDKIQETMQKEKFEGQEGIDALKEVSKDIKELRVEIQINKIRRLSILESYSHSFKILN